MQYFKLERDKKLKDDFLNRNERQPTIDEARQINVSGYALSKTA